jgi:hypothetical protein
MDRLSVLRLVLTVAVGSAAAFCWYGLAKPFGRLLELADDLDEVQGPHVSPDAEDAKKPPVDPDAEDTEKEAAHLTVV